MVHFEIKDLSFYYPTEKKKPALSHINLKIERGQYVTVCGKTSERRGSSDPVVQNWVRYAESG